MSQDVVRWLNEVKVLQEELQKSQASEGLAHASADNWRQRYEIEAQQRRSEARLMQQTIDQLRAEIEELKNLPQVTIETPATEETISTVNQLQTIPDLQAKLLEIWAERDHLAQELKLEQAAHAQTRKSLTFALGDTVELLTKLKQE
jgi:hypothetical protein